MSVVRRSQKKKRRNPVVQLTVISLMDIFTILLLFLLMHVGDESMALPVSEQMRLPTSTSKTLPKSTVTLMVTEVDILVDGIKLMSVKEALKEKNSVLKPLKAELVRLAERTKFLASKNTGVLFSGKVTVMGDRKIPFRLLKKIMNTCAQAEYPDISLAVMQAEQIS